MAEELDRDELVLLGFEWGSPPRLYRRQIKAPHDKEGKLYNAHSSFYQFLFKGVPGSHDLPKQVKKLIHLEGLKAVTNW